MDPPTLLNQVASYHLAEIWNYPISGVGVGEPGGGLELTGGHFGTNLGHFGDNAVAGGVNLEASGGADDPTVLERSGGGKRRGAATEDEAGKSVSTSGGGIVANGRDGKRLNTSGSRDENRDSKTDMETSSGKPVEQPQPADPPKLDYIHVRARRGQATDSHSLAERARREKISERMKILQDLVPGCNKVIGKALVLDEIINYIQSLQRQVEFLSMKLEAVNSRMNSGIEEFPSKEFGHQTFDTAGLAYSSPATREYGRGPSPEWLHMQVGGGFDRT